MRNCYLNDNAAQNLGFIFPQKFQGEKSSAGSFDFSAAEGQIFFLKIVIYKLFLFTHSSKIIVHKRLLSSIKFKLIYQIK